MAKSKKLAMADVTPEDQEFINENATPQEHNAAHGHTQHTEQAEHTYAVDESADTSVDESAATLESNTSDASTPDLPNVPTTDAAKKKYLKDVAKLGNDRGLGGKALVEFAKKVVEGAQEKVLVAADAKALYESFKRGAEKGGTLAEAPGIVPDADIAFGASSTKDAKNKSFDAQVSKLRAFIKFGNGYADDASEILSSGIAVHLGMMKDRVENIKYKSTYAALYALCVEQCRDSHRGVGMSADEIEALFMGKEPVNKTGLDLILTALDNVQKALKGKAPTDNQEGRDPVSSSYAEEAVDVLRNAINEIDPSGNTLREIDDKARAAQEKAAKASEKPANAESESEEGEQAAA